MSSPATGRPAGGGVRILLVAPDAARAAELERALIAVGHEVIAATAGAERLLELTGEERPDLAVVAVELDDDSDGIELAAELRRRFQLPVVLTAIAGDPATLERARRAAPYGFLVEPIHAHEICAAIAMALDQHRLATEVLASRAWLGTVLDGIREGVLATGADGCVRFLNPVAEELTGWPLDEALDRPLEEIYRLTDLEGRAIEPAPLRAALDQRRSQDKKLYLLHRRDGIEIAIEDLSAPFAAGDDVSARGAVTVFSDVSDRLREVSSSHEERQRLESRAERAVHALGESRAELRALAANLLRAREEEGQRIARELHDDFSQRLALVAIEAETLRRQVPSDELRAGLDRIIERSEQVAADLRALSHRMHPSVLADLGLVDALRALVVESQIELVEIEFDETPEVAPIPMSTSIALYRIAQEALRNVTKHAPRARVTMRLVVADDEIRLEIEDDGPGFDLEEARRRGAGMGLISIHERARLVGGRLEVDSAPGAGTRIRVAVPADGDD